MNFIYEKLYIDSRTYKQMFIYRSVMVFENEFDLFY